MLAAQGLATRCSTGSTGPTGPTGPTGSTGSTGSTVLTGSSAWHMPGQRGQDMRSKAAFAHLDPARPSAI